MSDAPQDFLDECFQLADESGLGDLLVASIEAEYSAGTEQARLATLRFLAHLAMGAAYKAGMSDPAIIQYANERRTSH